MTNPLASAFLTPLDHALSLARRGLPVFPLVENGKIPAIGGWQQRATTDEAKIRKMWTEVDPVLETTRVKNYNIGVYTGDLLVGDVDVKQGKKGRETFDELDVFHGFPRTFKVRTASGGVHVYYEPKEPAASGVNNVGPGFDTRGVGGYVVGPGSVVDGAVYEIIDEAPIAKAPEWLEERVGKPAPKTTAKQVVQILDVPARIEKAKALLETAPPAVSGNGGNTTTFKTAARVKDLGISELTALDLMAEIYNPRCSPEWSWEELANIVTNAYKHGKRPIGASTPEAEFEATAEPEDPLAPKKQERPKLFVRDWDEIKPRLADTYLIQRLLGESAMSVVYGESNVGKTFFAMAVAYAVAAGLQFAGRKTQRGAVLYVAAEAGVSAENRVAALQHHFKGPRVPFGLVPCPVDLLRPGGDTKPLIELVRQYEAKHGRVRLVVIDTLSRAIAGGNENSPDDMGALVKHLDMLRVTTQAHVMVVHHSGKDTAKGARGHSLLRAATDTEIEIQSGIAKITKQRDMEMGASIGFDLKVVDLGTSSEGEKVTSCVAVPISEAEMDFGGTAARNNLVKRALRDAVAANGGKPVSWDAWQQTCTKYIEDGITEGFRDDEKDADWRSSRNSVNKSLRTIRDRLGLDGVVRKNKAEQWIMK
jgi:hypothetical protein